MMHLRDWFVDPPKRGEGWTFSPTFRTNGYEFHFMFEKNVGRGPNGKRCKVEAHLRTEETDFDGSYTYTNKEGLNVEDLTNFVACDVGHHNLVTAVSPTGEMHLNGTLEMEVRNFTKKMYNCKSNGTR